MSNKKTMRCIDCGKEFVCDTSEKNDVVCDNCIQLLKRQFWSSVKISMIDKKLQEESKEKERGRTSANGKEGAIEVD